MKWVWIVAGVALIIVAVSVFACCKMSGDCDRLPEFNQPCLCYKKVHGHPEYRLGKYLGATFSDNCAAFRSMSHFGCIGATHWMPLPQLPKGE